MKKPRPPGRHNPVAKHAVKFNRAQVFRDKSKYRRHAKHKGREPWPVRMEDVFTGQGFFVRDGQELQRSLQWSGRCPIPAGSAIPDELRSRLLVS